MTILVAYFIAVVTIVAAVVLSELRGPR